MQLCTYQRKGAQGVRKHVQPHTMAVMVRRAGRVDRKAKRVPDPKVSP